jgi:FtsP/CotA-like multicopper oxidase with cupredoxin domain
MGMDMGSSRGGGHAGLAGMMMPGAPTPAAVRGMDPSAEQNASRGLWKATGWTGQSDHGSVKAAAGAAMAAATGSMAGMDHSSMAGMNQSATSQAASASSMAGMDHSAAASATPASGAADQAMAGMDHGSGGGAMRHSMRDFANAPQVDKNPGVQTISPMPADRTGEPPVGLEGLDHRVLVYRDLVALDRNPDVRAPSRSLDIHLTGNMERYMWSFDGVKLSEPAEPIPFRLNERVRVTLINDTMMPHPIHLHGHFFELVTGHGGYGPRKHTVNVPPGGKVSFDVTADAQGDWAFHCHNLYHMTAGMMRVVTVRPEGESSDAA